MNKKKKAPQVLRPSRSRGFYLLVAALLCLMAQNIHAQRSPQKVYARASQYSHLPGGYTQVGNTQLYYAVIDNAIDILGYYNGYYYSSTYGDRGYRSAIKVDDHNATNVDCRQGTTSYGVEVKASIEQQGEMARICYTVTNTNASDVTVSMGVHADVMIGNNDSAPISRRTDTIGQTYGLTMKNGNGAQLCVLFGAGLAGVTTVSDYWFGHYSLNYDPHQMVGNYTEGSNYMQENGSYDSGMGWCWKDRTIPAATTLVFSYLIGVGEVNLEPNTTFEVTPDDVEGWNDLTRPHRLTLNGSYESPAGLEGFIDYAVEDGGEWIQLTETLKSGDEFTASLVAMFDPEKPVHVIKFRTRDLVGNTTLLLPIEYVDVAYHNLSGIRDWTFTGDSIYQSDLQCDLDENYYTLTAYHSNVNAGTASFNIEGVFPYTIGRRTYKFEINPQRLTGNISLTQDSFVYNGQDHTPEWQFSEEKYADLLHGKDYTSAYTGNRLPGSATLTITGINNYTGTLTASFSIEKAPLADTQFALTLPPADITYDGQSHGATITTADGVGEATITYLKHGSDQPTTALPTAAGQYTAYLEFAEGTLYHGRAKAPVGTFTIYDFDPAEWALLCNISEQYATMATPWPWDLSQGIKSVSTLHGLTISHGHVLGIDLENQNLTGDIPTLLLTLPQLESLNLAHNHFSGDLGSIASSLLPQQLASAESLREIDLSDNQLTGNLGAFAQRFPHLTSLSASRNSLEDVYPMISPEVTTLDISHQAITRTIPLHLAELSTQAVAEKIPTILLYDHQRQTYSSDIDLMCTTTDGSWAMMLSYRGGQLAIPYVSQPNAYRGQSGDIVHVAVYDNDRPEGSTFPVALTFDEGDSNFDGHIDVLDLQSTILYALGQYAERPFNFTAANTFTDESINVQDIVCTVNILLANAATAAASTSSHRAASQPADATDSYIYIEDGRVMLHSAAPVAALSLGWKGNVDWRFADLGLMKSKATGSVVAYSLEGQTIPAGDVQIGVCHGPVTITHIDMADAQAERLPATFVGDILPTGITDPSAADDNATAIYSPSGLQFSTLQPGINIIQRQGRTLKIMK